VINDPDVSAASLMTASVPNPLVTVPLSEEDRTFWRAEIERARVLRRQVIAQWDSEGNLARYTPPSVRRMEGGAIDAQVNCAADFSDVQIKSAALFYDTPQVTLVPDPETNGAALPLHAELINALLSDKKMKALATIRPTIQDCLVVVQPCPTEIGYDAVTVQVPQPVMDPATGQPALDGMGQPVMQVVPVVVWEEFFWRKVSGKASLIPASLRHTQYDAAPWLGHEFCLPLSQAQKTYVLPPDFQGSEAPSGERPYFQPLGESRDTNEPMVSGCKIWYRAYLRDAQVVHPEVIRELVLVDSLETEVVHRPCPYQTIGPDGRLTPDSMIGYPAHLLALRDLTDAPYTAADCTITARLTDELNKYRTQVVQKRDGSKLHMLVDVSKITPEVAQKIEDGVAPKMIPVAPGALDGPSDSIMRQVPAIDLGRENYTGQQIIEHDRAKVLGIDANQVGVTSSSSRTATEISTAQRNSDARFEAERQRAVRWFLAGVQKLSALVLRYGDRMALEVLGPQRGNAWAQARAQGLFARFACEIVADSGNYLDINDRKRQDMQLYNHTAQDPTLNRGVIQTRLATDFGLDPAQWIQQKAPEQKPEPMTTSFSVKTEDLNPLSPAYANVYAILTAQGVKGLQPPMAGPPMMAPPPMVPAHGGMAEQAPRLNQHQLDETGERAGPPVM